LLLFSSPAGLELIARCKLSETSSKSLANFVIAKDFSYSFSLEIIIVPSPILLIQSLSHLQRIFNLSLETLS